MSELYRTVVHLKHLGDGQWVAAHPAASIFLKYIQFRDLPQEYKGLLSEEGELWVFARSNIGTADPDSLVIQDWELEEDKIGTRAKIDSAWAGMKP